MQMEIIHKSLWHIVSGVIMASLLALASSCIHPTPKKTPQIETERVPSEIQVRFESGKYEIKRNKYKIFELRQEGSVPTMEGFSSSTSPGDPMLPVRIYEIAVPPNIDWKTLKLSFDLEKTFTLPDKYDILPAPPMRARVKDEELVDWGEGKNIVNGRNMNVYGRNAFFPEKPVRIVSQSQLRKWKIVKLEFYPVQYNPVTRILRINQSANVKLNFTRIGREEYRKDPILKDTFMDKVAIKRFLNSKEALEWYRYVPPLKEVKGPLDPDYVIITTNAIRDNSTVLSNFVAHKTALGHSVQIVTESDYGALTGQAPNGRAEKIRQWLIDNYVALCIHYVLLIGNPDPDDPSDPADTVGDVPMKMMWPMRNYYTYRESPTDYFYADLTGNWDLDGDGYFGEDMSVSAPVSPDPSIDSDTFSVRWTGKIEADADGTYYFSTVSDNGIRAIINGTTVIDNWTSHEMKTDSGSIYLTAGQHDIKVEYYDDTGEGAAYLMWLPPGQVAYGFVPSSKLYHLEAGSYVSGGLDGEYFNNIDLTNSVLKRVDSLIYFYWGSGDKGPGGVDFLPEVFVGRIPVYNNDYTALDSILQKIINYETGAPPAWRKGFLTADVELWNGESDYKLSEALKSEFADPLGFTTYRVYESNVGIAPPPECLGINAADSDPAAPCNMLGEWANGGRYGVLTWSTHGGPSRASQLMVSADNTHLNDTVPAFTFQGSCLNGYPEVANNLGYALLRQGAIGTVSASRVSWTYIFNSTWDPNPQSGSNGNLTYHYASRMMKNQTAGHALYQTKADVHPDGNWMNKTDYNLYGDPSSRLIRGLAVENMLKNPNAALGSANWVAYGEAFIDSTMCGNPSFAVRNKGYFLQDVAIPPEAIGKYAVLIARISSERINTNGSITGLPYLYGYMMDGNHINAYLQGQNMLCSATVMNQWVAAWGIFKIPPSTNKIRFFLNQAERSEDPQNGSVARFDDVGLYIAADESSASQMVTEFEEMFLQ
jgi:hypothetical protein